MPVSNLQSKQNDRVWRSSDLTPQVIIGDWGGDAQTLSAWSLKGVDMIGAQVQVEFFDGLGSPATKLYDSGLLDFFSMTGGWGTTAWGSLSWLKEPARSIAKRALLTRYFPAVSGVKSFAITIVNSSVSPAYFELRRLWMGEYIDAANNVKTEGVAAGWASNSEITRIVSAGLDRLLRGRWREMRFEVFLESEEERSLWNNLLFVCDPGYEVLMSLAQDASKQEFDFSVMGSLKNLNPPIVLEYNMHTLQMEIVES